MNSKIKILQQLRIPILLIVAFISVSCNSFEDNFYSQLKTKSEIYHKTKKLQQFDLSKITNFDWDYFQYIRGNESVEISAYDIKKSLDLNFNPKTLDLNKTRFYFFKNKNLIREIEINSEDFKTPYFTINYCNKDINKTLREESVFSLSAETNILLFPNCRSK